MVKTKDYKNGIDKWKAVGIIWALGIQFAGSVVVCIAIGYYLDQYLKTPPLFLFIFTIAGFAGGVLTIYRSLRRINRRDGNRR